MKLFAAYIGFLFLLLTGCGVSIIWLGISIHNNLSTLLMICGIILTVLIVGAGVTCVITLIKKGTLYRENISPRL